MSNDKQQTSVEWYAQRLYDLEIAYNQGVIETDIYIHSKIEAKQQAKEMEKEQIEQAKLDAKEIIIIKHTEHGGGNNEQQ
jgi:uncharacterized protein (DUF2126 family)